MSAHPRRRPALGISIAVVAIASLVLAPSAAASGPTAHVVVGGLNNPRGIAVTPAGLVFVAETGTGRVLAIDGTTVRTAVRGLPFLTSPEGETTGVVNVAARLGRITVAIGGGPQTVDPRFDTIDRITTHHRTRIAANIQAYRNTHPDTTDLDTPPNPTDSNAYGLAALPLERFLVTDAAGNELDLIGSDDSIRTVAKFPNQVVSTSHLPAGILPPTIKAVPAEAVPTTVAVGPDGWWYVGELKGFPFTPGASRVWRVSPSARNVVCNPAATSGPCTVFADGFTSITGLDFGPDGSLYVAEMVKGGVGNLFFNSGDLHGAVIKVRNGVRTELAPGSLVLAGDVAISSGGTVYVTDHTVIAGQGRVLAIR